MTISKTVVRLIKKKRKMLSHYSLLLTKAKIISAPTTPVMMLFLGRLVRTIGPWVGVQLEGESLTQ